MTIIFSCTLFAAVFLSDVSANSSETTISAHLILFIDRFGDVYINKQRIELDNLLQTINKSGKYIDTIDILYAPFSYEFDRKRISTLLKSLFPKATITLKQAKYSDFSELMLKKNNNQLISQILAHRNKILELIAERHQDIFVHLQNYIIKLRKQFTQISTKISVWNEEYKTITKHKEGQLNE